MLGRWIIRWECPLHKSGDQSSNLQNLKKSGVSVGTQHCEEVEIQGLLELARCYPALGLVRDFAQEDKTDSDKQCPLASECMYQFMCTYTKHKHCTHTQYQNKILAVTFLWLSPLQLLLHIADVPWNWVCLFSVNPFHYVSYQLMKSRCSPDLF